MHRERY